MFRMVYWLKTPNMNLHLRYRQRVKSCMGFTCSAAGKFHVPKAVTLSKYPLNLALIRRKIGKPTSNFPAAEQVKPRKLPNLCRYRKCKFRFGFLSNETTLNIAPLYFDWPHHASRWAPTPKRRYTICWRQKN